MNKLNNIPRVIAITGGKGGVGKTSVSVNLSIALSRMGSNVCLLDGDTGLANINVMLGLYPAYTLEHLFTGERSIQDIVIDGPEGVQIIPGASGFAQCVELDVGQQQRLVTSIQAIEPHYDYMLVDTAAGISPTVLHFIAASQVAVIVITPEPTSLTDAFSLLKVLRRRGYRRKVQVIVNMASSSTQAEKVFRRFRDAVFKYLELAAEYLGPIWMDESMRTAVTLQRPVALYPKNDPSARSFYRLAERIDDVFNHKGVPKLAFSAYWQKLVERSTLVKTSVVVESVNETLQKASDKALSQIQKQQAQIKQVNNSDARIEKIRFSEQEISNVQRKSERLASENRSKVQKFYTAPRTLEKTSVVEPLSDESEVEWLALRIRLNKFFSDENTTPEQVTTLLSSCIYSFGDRLGDSSVDLLHGLLHSIKPEKLSDEQKQLLLSDYEYLGLNEFKQLTVERPSLVSKVHEEELDSNEDEIIKVKQNYDASGFGCQQELAQTIKNASENLPLESLLESIKYASLVESSGS
ncbi:MAG: MinD-like ATPase involved in chromosome partitioning or flagellar assembly [Oleiphilaceae bacterium]|jgi:MinD-like ATPase involved in chromosome partitioning or flagellar assembly